jgi:hypothetical protein
MYNETAKAQTIYYEQIYCNKLSTHFFLNQFLIGENNIYIFWYKHDFHESMHHDTTMKITNKMHYMD